MSNSLEIGSAGSVSHSAGQALAFASKLQALGPGTAQPGAAPVQSQV